MQCYQTFGYYRGGYGGMLVNDPQGYYNNLMFENGNGGIYVQNGNGWSFYYSRQNGCGCVSSSDTNGYNKLKDGGVMVFDDFSGGKREGRSCWHQTQEWNSPQY